MDNTLPEDIISNDEIETVHANANFGPMTKRAVVNDGVVIYYLGFHGGHTQMQILMEHGLIRKSKSPHSTKGYLTAKGRQYLKSLIHTASFSNLMSVLNQEIV